MTRLAGVELGGTNALVALGEGTELIGRAAFKVTDPGATLGQIAAQLARWNREQPIEALGVASFGPIRVDLAAPDHGHMLPTPKPGWSGADVLGPLAAAVAGPAVLQTDVTAAALAEGRWGAAHGCSDHLYITIGTGVGIGIVAGGRPIIGRMHPEGGHLRVRRVPSDEFAGNCPYHGDCLEGLISGPALAARLGCDPATLSSDHPVWQLFVDALAEACADLLLLLATERIVVGGGVIRSRPELLTAAAKRCSDKLAGYLPFIDDSELIVPAALENAGVSGALHLAELKLSDRYC
ncbi:ROK family protein [Sphingomonas sp. BN140010]|uniref:fructokinase n=1 Tax=Sphingomonas arvum TaxID=2992113 RepID=A0ABT3JF96_9SPHN|nr:ROK family protein [Sphingomonas sp. BN140010]MCW3797614.1 ROK family protein [Sphingomonas sp. BN140010]